VHCRDKELGPDVDLNVVARGTPGFSGADLANLANEAAIFAVRNGRDVLSAADFDDARDRILLGRREGSKSCSRRRSTRSPSTRRGTPSSPRCPATPTRSRRSPSCRPARHSASPELPLVERHLYGEDYLTDSLAVRLGGRAAEP